MKLVETSNRSRAKSIVNLQRARPQLLDNDIDENVSKYIVVLRYKVGQATFSIVIALAKVLIEKGNDKSLKVLIFGNDWAQSLLRRMGFKKSAATTGVQTPSKYIQSSRYAMEKSASKSLAIADSRDKLAITTMFIINLVGNFLLTQLIYFGKTDRSLPKIEFPKGFSLSANPKHYSSQKET